MSSTTTTELEQTLQNLAAVIVGQNLVYDKVYDLYEQVAERNQLGKAHPAEVIIMNKIIDILVDGDITEEMYHIIKSSDLRWFDDCLYE
jgi:hypothetical protein